MPTPTNGAGAPLYRVAPDGEAVHDDDPRVIERLLGIVERSAAQQTEAIRDLGRDLGTRLDRMDAQVGRALLVAVIAPLVFGLVLGSAALGVGLVLRSELGSITVQPDPAPAAPSIVVDDEKE